MAGSRRAAVRKVPWGLSGVPSERGKNSYQAPYRARSTFHQQRQRLGGRDQLPQRIPAPAPRPPPGSAPPPAGSRTGSSSSRRAAAAARTDRCPAFDEHAGDKHTSIELWWNGQHLITAVGGNDHGLRPDQDLRDCLEHLAATSDGWGCCATDTGTRVIWFSQRARAGERVPLVPTAPTPITQEGLELPREIMPVAQLADRTALVDGLLEEAR
ncbi:hypothetical protein SFUMM280S_00294 [Streptomyces fumanus]